MKRLVIILSGILFAFSSVGLTSCGLAQSAIQLPIRTGQSLGRSMGMNLEHFIKLARFFGNGLDDESWFYFAQTGRGGLLH